MTFPKNTHVAWNSASMSIVLAKIILKYILMFCVYRGHTVRAVCESFQMSKDAGFKVVAHMMPDLPNVGLERDTEQFMVGFSQIRNT